VGALEAFAHPTYRIKRLLHQASTWSGIQVCPPGHASPLPTARHLRPAEIDELVKAYEAGRTVYDLAAQFGIHRTVVGKHLRARGVDTKPPGLHSEDIPTAARLYQGGWSLARIGEKFATTANTVRFRLLEVGVVMRDTQGREL
jgi:hypothetical protein